LSQTAALRQTDPRQNHSSRHSFFRPLRVGTTRAPEHRHADLKIARVIPRSRFDFPTAISPVVAVRKHLGRASPLQHDVGKPTVTTVPSSFTVRLVAMGSGWKINSSTFENFYYTGEVTNC
jgi:hypothetical protein